MGSLNPKVLEVLRGIGGPPYLAELADLFLREGAVHLERLGRSLAARDARDLDRTARNLRGGAGNLGAQALAHLCGALQIAGKGGDWERAAALLPEIGAEFAATRAELEAEKARG